MSTWKFFETKLGDFRIPKRLLNDSIVTEIINGELFDWRIAEAMVRYYVPGTDILDAGCNLGQLSVCVSRALNRKIQLSADVTPPPPQFLISPTDSFLSNSALFDSPRIIGVEAQKELADCAEANFEHNSVNGYVWHAVIWDTDGQLVPFPDSDLKIYSSAGSYGVAPQSLESAPLVKTTKIDSHTFTRRVSVAKFDLQGSELKAWLGAESFITTHLPTLIFEFEEMFASSFNHVFGDFIDFLDQINYTIVEVVGNNNFVAMHRTLFENLSNWVVLRRRLEKKLFMNLISI